MRTSLPSRSQGEGACVLIAAQSGRALAAAARRAGYRPLVVDLFGDSDTRALAADYRQVKGRFGTGVAGIAILDALDQLALASADLPFGVVLGSGFEASPALIQAIDERFGLIGANADTVACLKDPAGFARMLAELGIAHPQIRLGPVASSSGWLAKRRGGSGGGHIRKARPDRLMPGSYLQRVVEGEPVSVAFLADGRRAQMVARTHQWVSPGRSAAWRYGGAIEPGGPLAIDPEIEVAIGRIVAATRLRGLASADLMVAPDRWWLLEVNPRPGATLDCLDRRETPLFERHCRASRGELGEVEAAPREAAGTMIVYAPCRIAKVPEIAWPAYVADRPERGGAIEAGAPVCTVAATGTDIREVRRLLHRRGADITRLVQQERVPA
ncbi:tetrahydromethanopterin C1 transfer protein [Labrys okinawensis]|uniref:Tetrahydromethanopterin C1 transfer protein n=1 Tax=Labrys okinawensis TaxID=346911 RepID=A0A2S9Q8T9_9HYPH|nr:ATP-grasp domain-containing protein [Labrys okinawensis]PRH85730.1 tetrahydromethanopterin C1 transfer protein [Labrys okinawensis]